MRRRIQPGDDADAAYDPLAPWIGANFWSRSGGPRMWTHYDGSVVRQELATLAEHGCNVTRSFCYWPDFMPAPERLDDDVLDRFGDFLAAHVEIGLGTIPTFLVGHMSGENWDPSWRGGRDLYRDVWMVSQQAWFAAEIARRYGRHPAVAGWLVSNEMPLYGGPGTSEEVTAWARIVVQAVRSAGATQPISLGDGAWGVEVSGSDNGYSLRALAPLVDFVGPHVYPMQDDQLRQFLTPAFVCELCATFGKPVVLEEFGVSSDFASDEHAADYYRQVLHTTLLAGCRGWLAWNNCDYDDLRDQDPYRHHAFEMHFGLTDRHGRPKPQLRVLGEFAQLVEELSASGWERVAGDAAIVVPEHFERILPFTEDAYRRDIRDNLLQAYVAAREADLPVALVRERDGIAAGARLYLAASAKLLTAPGLGRLRELAVDGATVYVSYFAGSTPNQRGPWLTWLEDIFGVRHALRYGLVDAVEGDEVVFEFVAGLGDIAAGTRLSFRRRRRAPAPAPTCRSRLPGPRWSPSTAQVARRSCATRWAPARPFSARIRSSTSRRTPLRPIPRARGASTPRSPKPRASRAPFASTTRASSWAGFAAPTASGRSSSTARARRSGRSRSPRTASSSGSDTGSSSSIRSAWPSSAATSRGTAMTRSSVHITVDANTVRVCPQAVTRNRRCAPRARGGRCRHDGHAKPTQGREPSRLVTPRGRVGGGR